MRDWSEYAPLAFPSSLRAAATDTARHLRPHVDQNYRARHIELVSCGQSAEIPLRISFVDLDATDFDDTTVMGTMACCLLTRSTDGHLRQKALQRISHSQQCWTIPFVVLLSGEYVVEIANDLLAALPDLPVEPYKDFVLRNRPLMRTLRARATSYWDVYYRAQYPDRLNYPGLAFVHALEALAS